VVGTVAVLSRYPVKSTAGQALESASVSAQGFQHDRRWAVYTEDGGIASGKRTRRFRPVIGLLEWQSTAGEGDRVPTLISPAGGRWQADDPAASEALTVAFGQRLDLRRETTVQHHDEAPVHVITTSSLIAAGALVGTAVDHLRFRPNIVIDTGPEPRFLEDEWSHAELALGSEVILRLGAGMPRCVMIDRNQAGVAAGPKVLASLGAQHGAVLGLQADVAHGGTVALGDKAMLRRI